MEQLQCLNGLILTGEERQKRIVRCTEKESYVLRRNRRSGDFIKHIADIFENARENQPCVVVMDDMDKFANEDSSHQDA